MHGPKSRRPFHARLDDVRQVAENLAENHPVVAGARLRDGRKFVAPGELAAIDDDAADRRPVAAQKLGGRVDHDIGAVLDGPAKVRRGHGVVDHQRHAGFVSDGGDLLDIEHVHPRIGDGLAIDRARLGRDGLAEILRVVRLHELHVDADAAEAHVELRVGAAVERAGGDHFFALPHQSADGQELRRLAAGCGQRRRLRLRATPRAARISSLASSSFQ